MSDDALIEKLGQKIINLSPSTDADKGHQDGYNEAIYEVIDIIRKSRKCPIPLSW